MIITLEKGSERKRKELKFVSGKNLLSNQLSRICNPRENMTAKHRTKYPRT